jgi:hypothetical protein
MTREQDLVAAFLELADTLVDDYDVVEFLHRLGGRCVQLVNATEAGIMLSGADGTLRYVASSSERMRLIELFELQHDEGPCVDAFRSGVAVHALITEDADTRWPRFAPRARQVGFQSVSALPMRLRSQVIGALNLLSMASEPMSGEDQHVGQALADIATIGILQERALSSGHVVLSQLQTALESRVVIEQAKGIVAEHDHVSVDDAFTALRSYARTHHRRLRQTADQIVSGELSVDALVADSPDLAASAEDAPT